MIAMLSTVGPLGAWCGLRALTQGIRKMERKMADVMLHLDENTSHDQREALRNKLLELGGVMAAAVHDEKPHLLIIEYDPDALHAQQLIAIANELGLHAELIGL